MKNQVLSPEVSIVIPAYNEEGCLGNTVTQLHNFLTQNGIHFEIIIVNDGSTDRTGEIAENLSRELEGIRVIHHPRNLGVGYAFRTGIENAKGKFIATYPADGQHEPPEILRYLEAIKDADIVCGYRYRRKDPLYRRVNAKLWNVWLKLFLGINLRDIDSTKMYRSRIFEKIKIETGSAFWDAEVLVKAAKQGFRIKEIPVRHFPRSAGRQSGNAPIVIFRAFRDFFRMYRRLKSK